VASSLSGVATNPALIQRASPASPSVQQICNQSPASFLPIGANCSPALAWPVMA
jgi:hypothetical protein